MKLIIAGSRSITDYAVVRRAVVDSGLWALHKRKLEIVSGMAPGVDMLAVEFAKRNKLILHPYPAAWDNIDCPGAVVRHRKGGEPYNVLAGFQRNEMMAQFADALVAVWDGKSPGTVDMIKRAYAHDLFVYAPGYKEKT